MKLKFTQKQWNYFFLEDLDIVLRTTVANILRYIWLQFVNILQWIWIKQTMQWIQRT